MCLDVKVYVILFVFSHFACISSEFLGFIENKILKRYKTIHELFSSLACLRCR